MKTSKIFLACILTLAMLIGSFGVSYAFEPAMLITNEDGTLVTGSVSASAPVVVSGTAKPGEIVMISVLNPMDEETSLNESNIGAFLYWADDMVVSNDGSYSFTIDFSDCSTGDYIIRVSTSDTGYFNSEVLPVITEQDRDSAIAAINAATSISDVKNLFVNSDGARSLSLNISAYGRLGDLGKDSVYQAILDYKNAQPLTVENLAAFNSDVFLTSGALALYNQENSSDVINEFSSVFGLLNNTNTKNTYDLISSESQKQAALDAICTSDYPVVAEMQKAYSLSVFLYAVKNVPWQNFETILSANSYLFTGLSTTDYNSLKYKSEVALDVTGTLYASSSAFVTAFNTAVANQLKSENTSQPSGGSRPGGGGGFSGGSTVGVGTSSNPQVELPSIIDDSFADLGTVDWAKEAIEYLKEKGVISGVAPNTFAPQNTVKREEFIKMIVLVAGKYDVASKCNFVDVPSDNWSYSYIASAVNSGLVNGIDENNFGLGLEISRQDACVLLYRVLKDQATITNPKDFTDKAEISSYAVDAVNAMSSMGLVNGMEDGSFKPLNVMTRAEAAKLLYELCLVIGG